MKFQHLPLHDLEGATRNFEQLTATVLELAAPGTARKVAFGKQTVTWPGGSPDATASTITHGLGATPSAIIATSSSAVVPFYSTVGVTTFNLSAETNNGSSPALGTTAEVSWVAIG